MSVFRDGSGTIAIASTTNGASANFSLTGSGNVLRIVNTSALNAFVKTGVGAQTATTSAAIVPPHSELLLEIGFDHDNVAVTTPSTPTNLYVMRGLVC